jgi:hypothetical protein
MNDFNPLPVAVLLLVVLVLLEACRSRRFAILRAALSRLSSEWRRWFAVLLHREAHELTRFKLLERELSQLLHELKRRMPVYSAETVQGKEAEFIRDALPKKAPIVLLVVALVVFSAVAWWFSR